MKARVPRVLAIGPLATALVLISYAAGRSGARPTPSLTMAEVDLRVAPLEAHLTTARAELTAAQESIGVLEGAIAGLEALLRRGAGDAIRGGRPLQRAPAGGERGAGTREGAMTPGAARTSRTP